MTTDKVPSQAEGGTLLTMLIGVTLLIGGEAAVGYDPVHSYAQSKLALILLARDLDCRLRVSRKPHAAHVGVFAVHPGGVITPGRADTTPTSHPSVLDPRFMIQMASDYMCVGNCMLAGP